MSTLQLPPEVQRLRLDCVSWSTYERLLHAFDERRIRITYDQGSLEIMTLSSCHERLKHLLGLLIVTLAEELGQDIAGYGSVTMKRRQKLRGLEPDECFWIQNEPRMRGKKKYDVRRDPPPDLALEIDVSRSSFNRMSIYAALKVPEVWRWRKDRLELYVLRGENEAAKTSAIFPGFVPGRLVGFLKTAARDGEIAMLKAFRSWIRTDLSER